MAPDFYGAFKLIAVLAFILGGLLFGLGTWIITDDFIKVSEPIIPELEIIVKDNVVDTLYVYRKP